MGPDVGVVADAGGAAYTGLRKQQGIVLVEDYSSPGKSSELQSLLLLQPTCPWASPSALLRSGEGSAVVCACLIFCKV